MLGFSDWSKTCLMKSGLDAWVSLDNTYYVVQTGTHSYELYYRPEDKFLSTTATFEEAVGKANKHIKDLYG